MWWLQHGADIWMIEQYEERKLKKPDWMLHRPTVPQELLWYWDSFWELDTERKWTQGLPRGIPWSGIQRYAQHHKTDFDYLLKMIRAMDGAYLTHKAEEHEKRMRELERNRRQKKR